MSRIYFHTRNRTVEVHGSERAYINCLGSDMAMLVLRLSGADEDRAWLRTVLVDCSYNILARDGWWTRDFQTWMSVGWDEGGLLVAGEKIGASELCANTLISTGSPVLALMAKLEGTCEDHAWIEGEDAGWAAALLREGRERNLLRPQQGWEKVIELLDDVAGGHAAQGPVVLSYSVCQSFPHPGIAEPFWQRDPAAVVIPEGFAEEEGFDEERYREDASWDAWYDLPESERWNLAEAGMRARKYTRQIAPALVDIGFQSGASAFDLAADRWDLARDRESS